MTMRTAKGRTRARQKAALALLLACSALTSPVSAQTQSNRTVFPAQGSALPSAADATAVGTSSALRGTTTSQTRTGQQAATDASNSQAQPDATVATGTIPANGNQDADVEPPYADDLNQPTEQDLDPGTTPVQSQELPREPGDPTGIRVGSFLLRPSISQGIDTEITRSNSAKTRRDYLSTGIRGTLSSDWSRHSLTVTGEGTFERNISGGQQGERPEANINADLRLDLSNDTIAHITGGYSFTREDDYDPNAVGGAATQSGLHQFTTGSSIERDFGKVRGLAALNLRRSDYTDAKLSDGSTLSMKDRNNTGIDGRLRLGYELSPAIIPFLEVGTGHTFYDRRRDFSGYQRSSQSYAARTGVQFDLGEKLRGEVGTGYEVVDYQDSRLKSIGAVTFNGNATWSPKRGTDVDLGLRTTVQDSTTPRQSGWVEYQLTAAVAHELRDNLVARLTSTATLRDFPSGMSDETVWVGGAELSWAINRYLDLTGNVEYERSSGGGSNDRIVRAGVGLTLKR
ncbi:outer membrane beta-barrel protein [Rhizobium sp. XQZ8]|uniref:outer membrane beta-barrel protein n=1 Tax=Rhizobium populisoli TaxID=2859785 RepID=UPI001CA4CA2A|nr:outer membrane beta-barrel protein [Rhizobium populisoli]MBW6421670.1 outer membrane beta-barrel protein [Rhizobium populisoli]